jgi:aspartate-semialdehyde dehydrogenase
MIFFMHNHSIKGRIEAHSSMSNGSRGRNPDDLPQKGAGPKDAGVPPNAVLDGIANSISSVTKVERFLPKLQGVLAFGRCIAKMYRFFISRLGGFFMNKYRVGIVGATGMVGQRFVSLLAEHPWFDVAVVAASARSAGKTYRDAVANRWSLSLPIPSQIGDMTVLDAADIKAVTDGVDFVFCAVDMGKAETAALEDAIAGTETPVVSNNSAHRWTPDAPMIIPEINAHHSAVIPAQRKRLGTKVGFVTAKPNCSIQSYVPALAPLWDFGIEAVNACTYQAISGAGRTFAGWPEMVDNVIPFIGGEEEKSEQEPLKIWGSVEDGRIVKATRPIISAQCIRVPASDGHLAAVSVKFANKPSIETILSRWDSFEGEAQRLGLPSAPKKFLTYYTEQDRPQTRLDRDLYGGMGISIGRLREDTLYDYKFVCLSHNTLRGAAGGGVLTAELLSAQGYIVHK